MEQLITILNEAATKLGVAVDHLYPQVLAVYWLNGVYYCIALPLYILISGLLLVKWSGPRLGRVWNDPETWRASEEPPAPLVGWTIVNALLLLALSVCTITVLKWYPYYLQVAFFPEGRFVMDMIDKLVKK